MTAPLNLVADWIRRLLGVLPDTLGNILWLPAFVVVLTYVLWLLVRRVLPWLAGVLEKVGNAALAVVAAPIMAILVMIAAPMRRVRLNPPSFVLAIDDAIVATTTVAANGLRGGKALAARAARAHFVIIVALTAVVVWRWNAAQCDRPAARAARAHFVIIVALTAVVVWRWNAAQCDQAGDSPCVTPVVEWAENFGDGSDDVTPLPSETPLPAPTDSPVPAP